MKKKKYPFVYLWGWKMDGRLFLNSFILSILLITFEGECIRMTTIPQHSVSKIRSIKVEL